jgi:hypothetical protein
MLPHPHRASPCMEPCIPCGEKLVCHTGTEAEKHCNPKTEPATVVDMWRIKSRHPHKDKKALLSSEAAFAALENPNCPEQVNAAEIRPINIQEE